AKTFLQIHPNAKILVIDEAKTVGGTWAKERLYPGLKTNNVIGSYEYGDFPMIPEKYGLEPGQHIPGAVVYRYFEDYAAFHNLHQHIRFSSKVTSASLQDDGVWVVGLADGTSVRARKLVIATGLLKVPKMPTFPGRENFKGLLFHAKELAIRAEELSQKREIVVIGGNKSAWDVIYTAAQGGTRVRMVMRPSGGGPHYIWPKRFDWGPFKSLSLATFISVRAWSVVDPSPFGKTATSGWVRYVLHQTRIGQAMCRMFWNGLDRHIKDIHRFQTDPELAKLEPWTTPFWTGNSASIHNYETSWFDLVRKGLITIHLGDVECLTADQVVLSNGEHLNAEAIVCCTGWQPDSLIPMKPIEATGQLTAEAGREAFHRDSVKAVDFIRRKVPYLSTLPTRTTQAPQVPSFQKQTGKLSQLHRHMTPWQPHLLQQSSIAYMGRATATHGVLVGQLQALWITAFFDDKLSHLQASNVNYDDIRYGVVLNSTYQQLRRPREAGAMAGLYPEYAFDSLTYVDAIMGDLELNAFRKGRWWREYFEPYRPKDYKNVVQEWLAKERSERRKHVDKDC
ncbi:hypothetical protein GE09DRAFT_1256645, partial [Coniochaeta sp. 2T2.1]